MLMRFRGRRGQGMTEYVIIVALIAVAAIGVVSLFGDNIRALFATSANALAGDEDATGADPVVIHNTETDAYVAFINQSAGSGPPGWVDDRGQTCVEFIENWVGEVLDIFSVEPSGKLTTAWGEVKHLQ